MTDNKRSTNTTHPASRSTSTAGASAPRSKYSDREVWTPIAEGEKLATEADANAEGLIAVAVEGEDARLVPFANVPSYMSKEHPAFWASPGRLGEDVPKSEEEKAEEVRIAEAKKADEDAAKKKATEEKK